MHTHLFFSHPITGVNTEAIRSGLPVLEVPPDAMNQVRVSVAKEAVAERGFESADSISYGLPVVQMLFERSPNSLNLYQPRSNYRHLDFLNHTEGRVEGMRGLHHVVLDANPTEDIFTTPIMLTPYKLVPKEGNTQAGRKLETLGTVKFTDDTEYASGHSDYSPSYLTGVGGVGTSKKDLEQMLSVFGLQYNSERTEAQNLGAFINLFKEVKLNSKINLVNFLDKYGFSDRGVQYDDDKEVYQNLFELGFYIRSLTPFRLAVVDGQHRANLVSLYVNGIFDHSDSACLTACHVRDPTGSNLDNEAEAKKHEATCKEMKADFFGMSDESEGTANTWGGMSVFRRKFSLLVGYPHESGPLNESALEFEDSFDLMHAYGHQTNTSAKNSNPSVDMKVVMEDAITQLLSGATFDFNDYIKDVGSNKKIHDELAMLVPKVIERWNGTKGIGFILKDSEKGTVENVTKCLSDLVSKQVVFTRGHLVYGGTEIRGPIQLLALSAGNQRCCSALRSLFAPNNSHIDQGLEAVDRSIVTGKKWITTNIAENLSHISLTLEDCVKMDVAINRVYYAEELFNDPDFAIGFSQKSPDGKNYESKGWTLEKFQAKVSAKSSEDREKICSAVQQSTHRLIGTRVNSQDSKTSDLQATIVRHINQELLVDVCNAVQIYGYNPLLETAASIKNDDNLNESLRFYMYPKNEKVSHAGIGSTKDAPDSRGTMELCLFLYRVHLVSILTPLKKPDVSVRLIRRYIPPLADSSGLISKSKFWTTNWRDPNTIDLEDLTFSRFMIQLRVEGIASFKTLDKLIAPLREGKITFDSFDLASIITPVDSDDDPPITRKRAADETVDSPASAGSNRTRSPEQSETAREDDEDSADEARPAVSPKKQKRGGSSSTKKRRKKVPDPNLSSTEFADAVCAEFAKGGATNNWSRDVGFLHGCGVVQGIVLTDNFAEVMKNLRNRELGKKTGSVPFWERLRRVQAEACEKLGKEDPALWINTPEGCKGAPAARRKKDEDDDAGGQGGGQEGGQDPPPGRSGGASSSGSPVRRTRSNTNSPQKGTGGGRQRRCDQGLEDSIYDMHAPDFQDYVTNGMPCSKLSESNLDNLVTAVSADSESGQPVEAPLEPVVIAIFAGKTIHTIQNEEDCGRSDSSCNGCVPMPGSASFINSKFGSNESFGQRTHGVI